MIKLSTQWAARPADLTLSERMFTLEGVMKVKEN